MDNIGGECNLHDVVGIQQVMNQSPSDKKKRFNLQFNRKRFDDQI